MSEPIKLKVTDAVSIGSTTIQIGKTETGAPGTEAEVTNSGTATDAVLDFVIPAGMKGDKGDTGAAGAKGEPGPAGAKGDTGAKGDPGAKGDTGAKGDAATVTIGTVTTGEPGTKAAVTNSGTATDAVLNFVIPAGASGAKGDTGAKGDPGADGAKGDTGAKGDAATVTIGTVTTGAPGTKAAVTNSGTATDAVLNFVIPAGATGATGANGDKGDTGATGADGKTPVRGTDYWTEEDINAIKAYCENAVLNGEW